MLFYFKIYFNLGKDCTSKMHSYLVILTFTFSSCSNFTEGEFRIKYI